MTNLIKKRRSKYFQQIIAKAMSKNRNTNVKGDTTFAEMQAKQDETLNSLFDMLKPVCGDAQANQIINTIRLGQRGETIVDCLPLMAVGEAMAMMRGEVRKTINQVRSYNTIEPVIELDHARACQNCEMTMATYFMVQKAYYTLYKRFMTAVDRPSINYGGGF